MVTQVFDSGPKGILFTEGALGEVFLIDARGVEQVKRAPTNASIEFSGLAAGRYVVRPGLRPCSGNCEHLDARLGACEATATVGGSTTTIRVRYRPEEPCDVMAVG